jgi:hypothetical protein
VSPNVESGAGKSTPKSRVEAKQKLAPQGGHVLYGHLVARC